MTTAENCAIIGEAAAAPAIPVPAMTVSVMTVSVIICTRDRGTLIEATLNSILAGRHRPDELLVVDQSDGEDTRRAVEQIAAGAGEVLYLPTPTRGLSRARNVGLEGSRGDLIVFTDDDVVVEEDWLAEIVREFAAYPRLAFLFGTVLPPEVHDWRTEFIPYSRVPTKRPVRWFQPEVFGGMGANMALRRTTFERVGGFDTALGAGTGVAGEDFEYALRCVCHRPSLEMHTLAEARVVHHAGARSGADYHAFVHQVNGTGMGQFLAYLVCGGRGPRYRFKALQELAQPLGGFLRALARGRKPSGLRTYLYRLQGFTRGLRR